MHVVSMFGWWLACSGGGEHVQVVATTFRWLLRPSGGYWVFGGWGKDTQVVAVVLRWGFGAFRYVLRCSGGGWGVWVVGRWWVWCQVRRWGG